MVLLNGKELKQNFISHKDIFEGAKLEFYMTNKPKK
jgi:putative alpha-1,2-mannosidase